MAGGGLGLSRTAVALKPLGSGRLGHDYSTTTPRLLHDYSTTTPPKTIYVESSMHTTLAKCHVSDACIHTRHTMAYYFYFYRASPLNTHIAKRMFRVLQKLILKFIWPPGGWDQSHDQRLPYPARRGSATTWFKGLKLYKMKYNKHNIVNNVDLLVRDGKCRVCQQWVQQGHSGRHRAKSSRQWSREQSSRYLN